jgi:hypothetical protein
MTTHPTRLLLTATTVLATALMASGGQIAADKKVILPAEREDIIVHPITAPYWHEDSFITTDLRPVYAYHAFPGEILGGGRATVAAVQLRVRLLKNLQLVAYKDGFFDIETKALDQHGWNDIAAGLKFAFLQRDDSQLHAAVGAGYEIAAGDDEVLQDDDELRFWLSVNKGFDRLHLGAVVNYHHSLENGDDNLGNSDVFSWHLHVDYQLCRWFSPVIEVNGYHVMDDNADNTGVVTPFQGADVVNLGGNIHEDVITAGVGGEIRPHERIALRAAYEFPLTDQTDIFGHRWTFSAVLKF